MPFVKGQQQYERRFTQVDIDRMWELYFGRRWSLTHIGKEYDVIPERIAGFLDSESARRWAKDHPNETNREKLLVDQQSQS